MIEIKNLVKNYGDTQAVKNINLSIKSGEILGLLGPNGAGKSSTLRILTGYLEATSGSITVKGMDVSKDSLGVKKIIGYLPESAPLYSDMLVFDYLVYIARIREIKKDNITPRLKELATLCGIKEVMHKSINSLSKGYKQRVGLAQAMMSDPEILVLDEPTTGLDPNQIVEIRNIIKRIGKTKTVIFSTHILSEAEATCDRIVIINNGEVAANGTADDIKSQASGEINIKLTLKNSSKKAVENLLTNLTSINETSIFEKNGIVDVSLYAKDDIRESLYLEIKKTDWILLSFNLEVISLENIFRKLTKEENSEE